MNTLEQIDYMILCLQMAKDEIKYEKFYKEKEVEQTYSWGFYKSNRTPNKALIKENLRNVGRTGFKLAKDLEVGNE